MSTYSAFEGAALQIEKENADVEFRITVSLYIFDYFYLNTVIFCVLSLVTPPCFLSWWEFSRVYMSAGRAANKTESAAEKEQAEGNNLNSIKSYSKQHSCLIFEVYKKCLVDKLDLQARFK